jgi:hypothetical protein
MLAGLNWDLANNVVWDLEGEVAICLLMAFASHFSVINFMVNLVPEC